MPEYSTTQKLQAIANVDEMLARNVGVGGGGGGGGDASATNQATQISNFGEKTDTEATSDTGSFSLLSFVKRLLNTKLKQGSNTAANSISVALSTDGPFAANFGSQADAEAVSDTGSFSFLSFIKRLLNTKIGSNTETAPASDTATSGINGRLQRIAQRLTSAIALLPTGLSSGGRFLTETTPTEATIITETALTAVGSTTARSFSGYNRLTYQVDVSGIGTNVVVRVEGNLQGSTYVNLSSANTDTTITSNGSYLFTFEGKLLNVRFTLVSISTGTPSVAAYLLRGN